MSCEKTANELSRELQAHQEAFDHLNTAAGLLPKGALKPSQNQADGVRWCVGRLLAGFGAVLADDFGARAA